MKLTRLDGILIMIAVWVAALAGVAIALGWPKWALCVILFAVGVATGGAAAGIRHQHL